MRERTVDGQAVTERSVFSYDALPPGSGRCVTTYAGGAGDPASFAGDPQSVRFDAGPEAASKRKDQQRARY